MFESNKIYEVTFGDDPDRAYKKEIWMFLRETYKDCCEFYSITFNHKYVIPNSDLIYFKFEEI